MIEFKIIPLPSNKDWHNIRFFTLFFFGVTSIIYHDIFFELFYVIINPDTMLQRGIIHYSHEWWNLIVGTILIIWSGIKAIEWYNDIIICVKKLKFKKAASLYNPLNKSPIYLKKSRVCAFSVLSDSIEKASLIINNTIDTHVVSSKSGPLEYRQDIGNKKSLEKLARINAEMTF